MAHRLWWTTGFILLYFAVQVCSQAQRSAEKNFNRPLHPGDVVIITGVPFNRSVGQIRFHSVRGSCDTRPAMRAVHKTQRLTCNPLVIKLRARRHVVEFLKKDMGNDNRDQLIQREQFPELVAGRQFSINIKVTYKGFEVKLNDHEPLAFHTNGPVGDVINIRAQSGYFNDIILQRGAEITLNEPDCGVPRVRSYFSQWARIANGLEARPGAYPWQAALRKKEVFVWYPYAHICGATLINRCWVVTAAHCLPAVVRYKEGYVVRLGDYHNGDGDESSRYSKDEDQQDFDIEEIYVHEDFSQTGPVPENDIAMIKLKEKNGECVRYSEFVSSVCLPEPVTDEFPDKTLCHISGWGAKNWTDRLRDYPHILRFGEVNLINFNDCRNEYGKAPMSNITLLQDGMICAGGYGVDTCHGDSGGPLVCQKNARRYARSGPFILWGITSWGHGCGDEDKPGVYTEVMKYIDWMKDVKRRYLERIAGTGP